MLILFDLSSVTFVEGMEVRACRSIREDDAPHDPTAGRCRPGWEHARPGDRGHVDEIGWDNTPSVRFRRTDTSTLAHFYELELVVPDAARSGVAIPDPVPLDAVFAATEALRDGRTPPAESLQAAAYLGFALGGTLTPMGRILADADLPTRASIVVAALTESWVFRRGLVALLMQGEVPSSAVVRRWLDDAGEPAQAGPTVRTWLAWVLDTASALEPDEERYFARPMQSLRDG